MGLVVLVVGSVFYTRADQNSRHELGRQIDELIEITRHDERIASLKDAYDVCRKVAPK